MDHHPWAKHKFLHKNEKKNIYVPFFLGYTVTWSSIYWQLQVHMWCISYHLRGALGWYSGGHEDRGEGLGLSETSIWVGNVLWKLSCPVCLSLSNVSAQKQNKYSLHQNTLIAVNELRLVQFNIPNNVLTEGLFGFVFLFFSSAVNWLIQLY